MKLRFFLIISVAALVGCGDVDVVKDSIIDSRDMTISQLLDNRKICESYNWDEFEDENDRIVIKYSCVFKNSSDPMKIQREEFLQNTKGKIAFIDRKIEKNLVEGMREHRNMLLRKETSILDKISSANRGAGIVSRNYIYTDMNEVSFTLKDFLKSNNYDELAYVFKYPGVDSIKKALISVDTPTFARILEVDRIRLEKMTDYGYLSETRKEIIAEVLVSNHDSLKEEIPVLIGFFDQMIAAEDERVRGGNSGNANYISEVWQSYEIDYDISVASLKENLKSYEKKLNDEKLILASEMEKSLIYFPEFEYVAEEIQWTVNGDGEVVMLGGRVYYSNGSDRKVILDYAPSEQFFSLVKISNNLDYKSYINNIRSSRFLKAIGL